MLAQQKLHVIALLRQALAGLGVTDANVVLERPKVGFRVPVSEWFRGPMRGYLEDHLAGNGSRTRDYYRPAPLRRVMDDHFEGRHNHEKLLWTMLSLEVLHRAVCLLRWAQH